MLNSNGINEEIKENYKKALETKDNDEHTSYKNLFYTAKVVLCWKIIAMETYFKNKVKDQSNNLNTHLKNKKEYQKNPNYSRLRKIVQMITYRKE